jgi:hypothetical protein
MKTSVGVKTWGLVLCAIAVMMLTVGSAHASTTYFWDFSSPNGTVASPHNYLDTSSTYGISASGWSTSNAAPTVGTWTLADVASNNLYGKFTLGDPSETGLGLAGQPSFEIQPKTLIQLDLNELINAGLTDLTLKIGSVQSGESWAVFMGSDSAANGAEGTIVDKGTGLPVIQSFTLAGPITSRYAWITATNVDVLLLDGLSATSTVPEPSTLLMFGLGLVGLAGIRMKFKK